jgi:G3E family GTPase
LRGDLIETLRDVLARRGSGAMPAFRRIILETTGLAEPAPILHALLVDPDLSLRFALAGVTTLVDAVNGLSTLRSRPESARQIALADRLLVAKSDLLPRAQRVARLAELEAALRDLNPSAPIVDSAANEFGPAELLAEALTSTARSVEEERHAIVRRGRPSSDGLSRAGGGERSSHGVQSFVFQSAEPVDPYAFAQFLSLLGSMLGPKLLRFKGLIALADRPETPIVVDGVQHVFHAPRALKEWPDADHATRAVIIVEGGAAREVDNLWAALTRAPRIDAPDLAALADNPLAPSAGGLLG